MNHGVISFVFFLFFSTFFAQNEFNQKGEREGVWIGYHENRLVKYSGQFFNGKEYGVFEYYDLSGNLAVKLNYLDTGFTSQATVYYANGAIKAQGYYYNKQKVDVWVNYSISGQKNQEEQYNQGVLDGESIYYYENGVISDSYNYENGKKEGLGKKFYKSGFLNMKCNYKDNLQHGSAQFYYNKSGRVLEARGMFNAGRKDSIWDFYDEKGVLIRKKNFTYED